MWFDSLSVPSELSRVYSTPISVHNENNYNFVYESHNPKKNCPRFHSFLLDYIFESDTKTIPCVYLLVIHHCSPPVIDLLLQTWEFPYNFCTDYIFIKQSWLWDRRSSSDTGYRSWSCLHIITITHFNCFFFPIIEKNITTYNRNYW